jgi:putative transposase
MRELSAQYPRYGYRRIRIFLGRDGYRMSPGRAYRLWRAASLQLPRKRPRKRVAAARPRPQAPCGPNQVWSYDFVFDHCAIGQQLKCLTVTDEFTKEGLAIDVDGRIRSAHVIEVLSRRPRRIQKPLNGLNDRARSSNRICRFLDRGELFACKFNFEDSLESQAVILLARADGAGEFCDATTRATGDQ